MEPSLILMLILRLPFMGRWMEQLGRLIRFFDQIDYKSRPKVILEVFIIFHAKFFNQFLSFFFDCNQFKGKLIRIHTNLEQIDMLNWAVAIDHRGPKDIVQAFHDTI
jgi:hypothetical protein